MPGAQRRVSPSNASTAAKSRGGVLGSAAMPVMVAKSERCRVSTWTTPPLRQKPSCHEAGRLPATASSGIGCHDEPGSAVTGTPRPPLVSVRSIWSGASK